MKLIYRDAQTGPLPVQKYLVLFKNLKHECKSIYRDTQTRPLPVQEYFVCSKFWKPKAKLIYREAIYFENMPIPVKGRLEFKIPNCAATVAKIYLPECVRVEIGIPRH